MMVAVIMASDSGLGRDHEAYYKMHLVSMG